MKCRLAEVFRDHTSVSPPFFDVHEHSSFSSVAVGSAGILIIHSVVYMSKQTI